MSAGRIRVLATDVDGTLTDGRIHMGTSGELFKSFDVRDGHAIAQMLPEMGVVPVVITARTSEIVERRCSELGVTVLYQGVADKLAALREACDGLGIGLGEVCYVGDDLNDLPCMAVVSAAGGIAACPADAANAVRDACGLVAAHAGGRGAVREVVEFLTAMVGGPGRGAFIE